MADQATSSITIDATPGAIMDVIADFAAYPDWAGFVKKAEVLDEGAAGRPVKAKFLLDAGVLKADYTLAYTWAPDDSSVSWTLESGSLKEMNGSYTLSGDSPTEVTYALSVDIGVPMLGMFKRKAEKAIMDTALKELKKRVEG